MADSNEGRDAPDSRGGGKRTYEPPQITWEEEYKPVAFGLSCGKVPGQPGCSPILS